MSKSRFVLAVVFALLVTGLAFAAAQTKDTKNADVQKLLADFTSAFNRSDAKAVAGLYTENAIRVSSVGGTSLGSVQNISANVAIIEGTYEITINDPAKDAATPATTGKYVNTLVKKDGAWLIASNAVVLPATPK